jgi:hypothetical protein
MLGQGLMGCRLVGDFGWTNRRGRSLQSSFMLLLLQAAAQAIPPIHVTVTAPPQPNGLPDWVKVLIGALAGTILGTLAEPVKESLTKWRLRKEIERHLTADLMKNLSQVVNSKQLIKELDGKPDKCKGMGLQIIQWSINSISSDRYRHYFDGSHKPIVYDIDAENNLKEFYLLTDRMHNSIPTDITALDDLRTTLGVTESFGMNYLSAKKQKYRPSPPIAVISDDCEEFEFTQA